MGRLISARAHYYCERTIQEHDMLNFKPSTVAAAATFLALRTGTPSVVEWVRCVIVSTWKPGQFHSF